MAPRHLCSPDLHGRNLRRWLGLPKSLSSIALYGHHTKLQLPFKSLEEEFKVTRTREVVQYRHSSDPKVAKAGIQVRTGRKWRAEEAVQEAETRSSAFVRAGEQPTPDKGTPAAILTTARDWQLLVDLERQLKFPSHIAATTLRPDIVLVSEFTK